MMMHESTDEYDNEAKMGLSRCLPGDVDRIQRKWGRWHSKGQLLSQPLHRDLCIDHLVDKHPAPRILAQVKWRTVAGTAIEGEDYEGAEGELVYTRSQIQIINTKKSTK